MTVYPDLSPYEYHRRAPSTTKVNVGWLGADHDVGGPVDQAFADALHRVVYLRQCNITRGYHQCPFCRAMGVKVVPVPGIPGSRHVLGHGESHFWGTEGVYYAVPSLIAHYVEAHGYQPPPKFVADVHLVDARLDRTLPPRRR